MGTFSFAHWVVVLALVLILFGAGRLPKVMGDVAKGVKNFRAGMKDDTADDAAAAPPRLHTEGKPEEPSRAAGGTAP